MSNSVFDLLSSTNFSRAKILRILSKEDLFFHRDVLRRYLPEVSVHWRRILSKRRVINPRDYVLVVHGKQRFIFASLAIAQSWFERVLASNWVHEQIWDFATAETVAILGESVDKLLKRQKTNLPFALYHDMIFYSFRENVIHDIVKNSYQRDVKLTKWLEERSKVEKSPVSNLEEIPIVDDELKCIGLFVPLVSPCGHQIAYIKSLQAAL